MFPSTAVPGRRAARVIYRHTLLVRVTHWVNVVCLAILLMSGLQIFNAHPALYWGNRSDVRPAAARPDRARGRGGSITGGVTTILDKSFATTGVLGASRDENGELAERGFPRWITIPSYQDLATGRRWHFFFAWLLVLNGAVYVANLLVRRHLKDFLPSGRELRSIPESIREHLRLRFPEGRRRFALQCAAKARLPLGHRRAADPGACRPDDVAGARRGFPVAGQSVRRTPVGAHDPFSSWRSISSGFVIVHVVMVLISGFLNNMISMITGRYAIEEDRHDA